MGIRYTRDDANLTDSAEIEHMVDRRIVSFPDEEFASLTNSYRTGGIF